MTAKQHIMPFGANVASDGVTFSLYAPDVAFVDLLIEDRDPIQVSDEGGWKRVHVAGVKSGQRYHYRLPGGLIVPDPAARFMPEGLAGPAEVIDPTAYEWRNASWRGRPWADAVLYEAHIGAATPEGSYSEFAGRLEALADLGVTAIEVMPVAQWRGQRNWGYDGVLPFAPAHPYGRPEDFKALVDRAHDLGLMVILDVVYNHFGPSGNYLPNYAKNFFTERHHTPWGAAINYDGSDAAITRSFFINNAVYWVKEYNLDGLRLDAVHSIHDTSSQHILAEISAAVRAAEPDRTIHLILENDENQARWLERYDDGVTPRYYTAQWNDDAHHCWHALLTGECDGYYADFCDDPPALIARSLSEGFVYQGNPSPFRNGEARGEKSAQIHPAAFIDFLQNHDQVGNRAYGERIDALAEAQHVALARSALLLSPHIPMLFMDEDWGATTPFLYFVDYESEPDLARAVRDGRQREFAAFEKFADAGAPIPDPNAPQSLSDAVLDAGALGPDNQKVRAHIGELLALRRRFVTPLLGYPFLGSRKNSHPEGLVDVTWSFEAGRLRMLINLGERDARVELAGASPFYASDGVVAEVETALVPPWSLAVFRC